MSVRLRSVLRVALRLFHFVYFPDEFIVYSDTVVRVIFTMYYLPVMAVAVALTHSVLEAIVYSLIMPLVKELEFELTLDRENLQALLAFAYTLAAQTLPFLILGSTVVTAGHKFINGIGEAMVDAFSRVDEKDYPLFAARLEYLLQKRGRRQILVVSCITLLGIVGVVFYSNVFFSWARRDSDVLIASWTIIASQAMFVLYTVFGWRRWEGQKGDVNTTNVATERTVSAGSVSQVKIAKRKFAGGGSASEHLLKSTALHPFWQYFLNKWWRTTIHRIRHLSMEMVVCCGAYWFLSRGLDGLSLSVEVLLYLNLPHLFGFLVMSFAVAMSRVMQSLFWLRRHAEELPVVLCLVLPQQAAILLSLLYFKFQPLVVTLFACLSVLLWARGIQLRREFQTISPSGVLWRVVSTGARVPPHIAAVLEDAFERQHLVPSMVSLDLSLDLKAMTMTARNSVPQVIERIDQSKLTSSSSSRTLWSDVLKFFVFAFPRLVVMQSAAAYGGRRFRNVRILLRTVTMTLLLVFIGIVAGVVVQAAIPQLRPLPVKVDVSHDRLAIDHFLVKLTAYVSAHRPSDPQVSDLTATQNVDEKEEDYKNEGDLYPVVEALDAYPSLCKKTVHGVNVWELSWLSTIAYITNQTTVERITEFMNTHMHSDWSPLFPSTETLWWNGFIEFHSKRRNVSVVAVRGTDLTSFEDALQDINMFFEVALYQTLSSIVPGATLLPSSLVSDFIQLASGVDSLAMSGWVKGLLPRRDSETSAAAASRDYFLDVQHFTEGLKARPSPPRNVVLVGHSLGGAVAHLVGNKIGTRSVGFSSPGLVLSHKKFGVSLARLHQFATTIVSSHDIVPLIGGQGGELHHVECVAKRRELCHAMEFAVGALWHACPSIRSQYPGIRNVTLR